MPLSGRSLAIDPFSFPTENVVHYLVNKNDIMKIAEGFNANHTSNPIGGGSGSKSVNTTGFISFTGVSQISTSSDIPTNTGSIHAAISWSPNPLTPTTQSTLSNRRTCELIISCF